MVLHEFDLLKELMLIVRCFLTVNVCDFSLSGGELFDRIAAEDYKMTEAEVINYLRQMCEGLKHMHENSIVHLDVKVRLRPGKKEQLSWYLQTLYMYLYYKSISFITLMTLAI